MLRQEAGRLGPLGAALPAESGSQVSEASSASGAEGALRLRLGLHARPGVRQASATRRAGGS